MNTNGLEKYDSFILWTIITETGKKDKKVPLSYKTGDACNPHVKANQTSFEVIKKSAELHQARIGFVINKEDNLFFIDIDVPAGEELTDEQGAMLDRFPGAFVETSQNGAGIHIIGSGWVTPDRRVKAKKGDQSFDMLCTDERFVALTFEEVTGDAGKDFTPELDQFVKDKLTRDVVVKPTPPDNGGDVVSLSHLTNDEVIKKAGKAKGNPFGGKATFTQLWEADEDALTKHFPDDHGDGYDASRADSALAQHLAFWCGGDEYQIDTLMRQSALAREKWDKREKYLSETIQLCVERQMKFYTPPGLAGVAKASDGDMVSSAPNTPVSQSLNYLPVTQQLEFFKGCVYVADKHKVLTPSGRMFKPPSFRSLYGGHLFALDAINDKTTKNAFEAFTENQGWQCPKVETAVYKPLQKFGEISPDKTEVNKFKKYMCFRLPGDATPFLQHVEKILPDEGDRDIILSYMAAMVQKQGVKFKWAPVIQGMPGNGKTILFEIIMYIIGIKNCHIQNPKDLGNVFNAWIEDKTAVCVEEVQKDSVVESIKDLITNSVVGVQGKGADQEMGHNCANFLLMTNHKNAVSKAKNDRRYSVFYTKQQEEGDIERDGLGPDYFGGLYKWLLEEDGFAIAADYLHKRDININVMGHAPKTSSHEEVMSTSMSDTAEILQEAINEGLCGFRDGFINLKLAREYLQASGYKRGPSAVKDLLSELGYGPLPFNTDGRVSVDGKKVTIFIKIFGENYKLKHKEFLESYKNSLT